MEHTKLLVILFVGVLVVAGLIFVMSSSSSQPPNVLAASAVGGAQSYSTEEADQLFQAQKWAQAEAAYRAITSNDPANGTAWSRLGVALHNQQKFLEAAAAYEKALELGVTPLRTMMSLVRVQAQQRDLDAAFEWLNRALDAGFNNVPVLQSDREFENLRPDARYQSALAWADRNAHPCEQDANYRQFDFWLGEWEVFDPQGNKVGENSIRKLSNGCVLLESWVNLANIPGSSINYYDATDQKWHQVWVDSTGGTLVLSGGLQDGSMVLEGFNVQTDGSKRPFRGIWTLLADGRVRQFFEESADGGTTWHPWFDGFYTRK